MKLQLMLKFFRRFYFKNKSLLITSTLLFLCLSLFSFNVFALTVEDQEDTFIYPKEKPEKVVYLTFDDGPSQYSESILSLLKEYNVPAIFFVIGESINQMPNAKDLLTQMANEGHYIGLHSMTHDMDRLYNMRNSPYHFTNEMLQIQKLIYELTGGFKSNLCRPPYGGRTHFKSGHYEALKEAGLTCIDWTVDSLDWSKSSADQIFNQVVAEQKESPLSNQVVLLFHEKKYTLEVLPSVIKYYRDLGYEFVPYIEGDNFNCILQPKNK